MRACMGQHLARLETRHMISELLSEFEVVRTHQEVTIAKDATLRPESLRVLLAPRF